ncbi:ribosomal RNA small subunit methyltransferase A [Candidatus Gracilibacteria bacterium]|nr:ribosomal RNA small subunit methyltransferase A [Candidatus Gracilibacteria bacterium]
MINQEIIERIIEAAQLQPGEEIIEVGPGKGILTKALLEAGCKVTAIEKDHDLIPLLKASFLDQKNFTLIHADALTIAPPTVPYKIVANIPYSITSPLLDHFIREQPENLPLKAVLLVQKEVAEKICSQPPHMNVLALHVQPFGVPKYLFKVGPENFRPSPKVDSAVIEITFAPLTEKLPTNFFEMIHKGFSQKRKMLRNTIDPTHLEKAAIDPTRRPETLTIDEWKLLARTATV